MMKIEHIFIGYDSRESDAYEVCKYSIERNTPNAPGITKLEHRDLRRRGYFYRPWLIRGDGQMFDTTDGKAFSTEFAHSRFITPKLARDSGVKQWAMFCDCDFLFLGDLSSLDEYLRDEYAVCVVKHRIQPKEGVKMDGQIQQNYPRKLWSSLMLFNVRHPALGDLDIEEVNSKTGTYLHGMNWALDREIGEIPHEWNYIPGLSPPMDPKGIHYSMGGPWFEQYEDVEHAGLWRHYRDLMKL